MLIQISTLAKLVLYLNFRITLMTCPTALCCALFHILLHTVEAIFIYQIMEPYLGNMDILSVELYI